MLLEINNLSVRYGDNPSSLHDFALCLADGEILGLVGESGCGKSTVIRSILGTLPETARIESGEILFDGKDLLRNSRKQWRSLRGSRISMIFQDCGSMMNPVVKIGRQFVQFIKTHRPDMGKKEARELAKEMLASMRLSNPGHIMDGYPFELSGGMRQRVGIAMAMTFHPRILLADEPTSALDVTTQTQIVRQMMDLRDGFGTSIIIVTHNFGVAAYMTDRLMVMRQGLVVEEGESSAIVERPAHEYTQSLIGAIPQIG
ncbi:MAG: ABC transporter ATP-binding protein [Deltaproteobacteria bacterium]|jgi:peptide/nickel transport system ATP-binding protein|nr:ABC transporter ATP-binding protein [Deltaproteobacteria bacterium]